MWDNQTEYAEVAGKYEAPFLDAQSECLCDFDKELVYPTWKYFKFLKPCTTLGEIISQREECIKNADYKEYPGPNFPLRATSRCRSSALQSTIQKKERQGN